MKKIASIRVEQASHILYRFTCTPTWPVRFQTLGVEAQTDPWDPSQFATSHLDFRNSSANFEIPSITDRSVCNPKETL